MGMFSSENEDDRSNDLIEQQMQQNQAEIEQKRQSLYRERIEMIKSQGAQDFTANREPPAGI